MDISFGNIQYIESEEHKVEKDEDKDKKQEHQYSSAFGNMMSTIKQMTVDKLLSHSGQERLGTEEIGMHLYKNSPIFGIGFGSFRTLSLITNVGLSTGIIRIDCIFIYLFCCT